MKLWASLAFFGFVTYSYIHGDVREESEIGGRTTPRGIDATLTQKSAKAESQEKKSRPPQQRQALSVKSSTAEANSVCLILYRRGKYRLLSPSQQMQIPSVKSSTTGTNQSVKISTAEANTVVKSSTTRANIDCQVLHSWDIRRKYPSTHLVPVDEVI